jgi:branched-chain amino acid aminotransferase
MSEAHFSVLVDGELRAAPRVALELHSPALMAGAGLYETLRVSAGRALHLDRHLQRLLNSAVALRLPEIPAASLLAEECRTVGTAAREGLLRVLLLHQGQRTQRIVMSEALPTDCGSPVHLGLAEPPVDGPRPLAQHKTLNGLGARVAYELGKSRGFDEVLLRTADGFLLEGTRSSLFVVRHGCLGTPASDLPLLPGITRELLLHLAAERGIPVKEQRLRAEDVLNAEEVFITASVRGIRSVATFEHQRLPSVDGPVTRLLREAWATICA